MAKKEHSKKTNEPDQAHRPHRAADIAQKLVVWYQSTKRELPWRINRDPYRIWISEVMLQQTTVVAVVPYYERFLARFPNLRALAKADLDEVLELWAGLGYYSRARNLHRAATELIKGEFPQTYAALIEFPGFGPYTARAVASLAFGEKTGVLDGNVIRILSRLYGRRVQWWKPKGRDELQALADGLASSVDSFGGDSADVNQGMMELGATICTPAAPACLLCPWNKFCAARLNNEVASLPLKKPRREREIWQWTPLLVENRGRIMVIENDYAPFLKGHWILPGKVERLKKAPEKFDYRGSVTHHDIFVRVKKVDTLKATAEAQGKVKWIHKDDLKKNLPASLVRKAIEKGMER
jgi:A/G-specific adenine glycosylase